MHGSMYWRIKQRIYSRAARIFCTWSCHFMLATPSLCSPSIFTLGEHKHEQTPLSQLINSPFLLADLFYLTGFLHFGQQAVSLIPVQVAQVHDISALYLAVRLNKLQYHLFLLDWVKTDLPDISRFLTAAPVDAGAERVTASPASPVGFD